LHTRIAKSESVGEAARWPSEDRRSCPPSRQLQLTGHIILEGIIDDRVRVLAAIAFSAVFLVFGWAAARIDIRHLVKESRALPRSYFQGLNFLLNEQPDRAIEAFVEAVKVDPQTVELHFALGSLFRRRGETDRAIRMHQNLIEREDLKQDLKLQALAELGQGLSQGRPARPRRGGL
jgi:tetratricopeptide (TPR) repeat protein